MIYNSIVVPVITKTNKDDRIDDLLVQQYANFCATGRVIKHITGQDIEEKWEIADELKNLQHRWHFIDELHVQIDSILLGKNHD